MEGTKIALVTGGSRGLGKDMALSLARKGLDVIITYRSKKEEADAVIKEIQAMGRQATSLSLDMNAFSAIDSFVQGLQIELKTIWNVTGIDYLVNNAGIGATVPFEKVTEDMFDEFLNVHFKSVFFLTQKLLPHLNDGGGIINISTGTTRFANPGYSVYASMKGAIEVFTKYLAKELGNRGIRANVIAPGPVATDFNNGNNRDNEQATQRLSSLTPLGRVGQPQDIGGVVAFLCTSEGAWINGQRLEVSGGINT